MGSLMTNLAVAALGMLALFLTGCVYERPHRVVEREVIVEHGPYEEREVVVTEGPPPPERVEVVTVRPYREAVWIRGHWVRTHHGWYWVHGYWR